MKVSIRAAAARDIDEAASWYRTHAVDPHVALRFLLELRDVLALIAESPSTFPEVHRDIRRCRVLAFPAYSVFYRVARERVIVLAVFHGRRRPLAWKSRR